MDPDFATAFSRDDPEGYSAALQKRRRSAGASSAGFLSVHVPVIPPFVLRFGAVLAVAFILVGAVALMIQESGARALSIPSGQLLNSSSGFSIDGGADRIEAIFNPKTDLGERVAPISEISTDFSESWND